MEERTLLVAAYWRTNLTMRRLAPLFGVSKSAADRIIDHLGPLLALQPRKRFAEDAVLIVDGTLVPTRDHTIAEQSKNYRYSTNHQVVIDADTRLVVVVGQPLPGNRNDCKVWGAPFHDTKRNQAATALSPTPWVRLHLGYYCPQARQPGTFSVQTNMIQPVRDTCSHCDHPLATSKEAPAIRLLT